MNAPLVFDPIVFDWACRQRGLCCYNTHVQLNRVTFRRMRARLDAADDPRAARLAAVQPDAAGWHTLPEEADGACLFLDDKRCGYRIAHDTDTLPSGCRQFPFLSLLTPTRHLVGLTFACPTALELLSDAPDLTVVEDAEATPPTEYVTWLGGDHRSYLDHAGAELSAVAFWERHDLAFAAFRGASGSARDRVDALADALGATRDPNAPPEDHVVLWLPLADDHVDDPPPAPTDDDDTLLTRYLAHRILVPKMYASRTDHAWLLFGLYLALVRFRLERERGVPTLLALRNVERTLLHSRMPARILDGRAPRDVWRRLAASAAAGPDPGRP